MEEHSNIVPLPEEGNMNNMDDKRSDFCRSHVHLQPYHSLEVKIIALSYEECKMKDNDEGK